MSCDPNRYSDIIIYYLFHIKIMRWYLSFSILHTNYAKLLKTMLQSEGLPVPIIRSLSSSILDQYIEAQHTGMPTDQAHKSQLRDILCTLQQRFPADLDAALENKVKVRFDLLIETLI